MTSAQVDALREEIRAGVIDAHVKYGYSLEQATRIANLWDGAISWCPEKRYERHVALNK